MNFYEAWHATRINEVNDFEYFKEFVNKTEKTIKPLLNGSSDEIIFIVKFLMSISLDELITNICKCSISDFTAENVIQFSNFEHAYINLPCLLLNEHRALDFNEIGSKIMHSKSEIACKKYGENHAKLASEMSFVTLERKGKVLVSLTNFGIIISSLINEDKYKLSLIMLCRNALIRNMIILASNDFVTYEEITKNVLSESTMLRRKSNVKKVVELILNNSSYSKIKNNIVW